MAELKTRPTDASVDEFIAAIADGQRRDDCRRVLELMCEVTGHEPRMWGSSIVGFGNYHYRYGSGHEGEWFLAGFSPRKADLTIYLLPGLDRLRPQLARLGKHKSGKGCLYLRRLADVDLIVLRELIVESIAQLRQIIADRRAGAGSG
jgi:hypothetical protein